MRSPKKNFEKKNILGQKGDEIRALDGTYFPVF